jgi:chemotaxis response regulator CheB
MPSAAIEAGVVDTIAAPAEIGRRLRRRMIGSQDGALKKEEEVHAR